MNLFLILIPQSLNSQFLNLAPYSNYDEDGVQKSDLVLRSNNEVCKLLIFETNIDILFFTHIIYVNIRKREKHEDCNSWRNPEKLCLGS